MASLKLLLGMIPSTAKIELAEKALKAEFEKRKEIPVAIPVMSFPEISPTMVK